MNIPAILVPNLLEIGAATTARALVDAYEQPEIYQMRLEKRKTASDHLLNAVIFQ